MFKLTFFLSLNLYLDVMTSWILLIILPLQWSHCSNLFVFIFIVPTRLWVSSSGEGTLFFLMSKFLAQNLVVLFRFVVQFLVHIWQEVSVHFLYFIWFWMPCFWESRATFAKVSDEILKHCIKTSNPSPNSLNFLSKIYPNSFHPTATPQSSFYDVHLGHGNRLLKGLPASLLSLLHSLHTRQSDLLNG